jgi:hypothetical protein
MKQLYIVYNIHTIKYVLTSEGEECQGFGNNKYIILLPPRFFPSSATASQ